MDVIHMIEDGGPFAVTLAELAPLAMISTFMLGMLRVARLRVPAAVVLIPPAALLLLGGVASRRAVGLARSAIDTAASETVQTMLAMAISELIYTSLFAGLGAAVALCSGMVGVSLGTAVWPGNEPRMSYGHTVAPMLAGVAAAIVAFATGHSGVGAVALVAALAGVVAGLRSGDAAAEARLQVGLFGAIGAIGATTAGIAWGRTQMFRAVAMAPAEMKEAMLMAGLEGQTVWPGWLAAGLLLMGGALSAAPVARFSGRSAAMGVLATLLAGGSVGAAVMGQNATLRVFMELTDPDDSRYLKTLAADGVVLPELATERVAAPGTEIRVTAQETTVGWMRIDLEEQRGTLITDAYDQLADRGTTIKLEADRGQTWATLHPLVYTAAQAKVTQLEIIGTNGTLVSVPVSLDGTLSLVLLAAPGEYTLGERTATSAADLTLLLSGRSEPLAVVPDPRITWGELATVVCVAACGGQPPVILQPQ